MLTALLKTMRPRQWTKNAFVFFALVFDKQLFHPVAFGRTLAGFALFCIVSSVVYIVNDISDIEADRQHPKKKKRPLPSGQLPVGVAWAGAIGPSFRMISERSRPSTNSITKKGMPSSMP